MKNIKIVQIWMLVIIIILATSCYKDNNVYDYSKSEVVTVTGINESYNKLSLIDRIQIDPVVESNDPDAEFEYFWGIYETSVQGYIPKLDTIARTKAIDYLVIQPAKLWVLVFGAKNTNTGYTKLTKSNISVITQYTRGWYVLKDDGFKTDVDLFLTPATIIPDLTDQNTKKENVFNFVNNKQLDGNAIVLGFYADYKSDIIVPNKFAKTRALFMVSDKDVSVVDINTFKEIHAFDGLFHGTPTKKAPDVVLEGSQATYIINDGKLHGFNPMQSIGLFGGAQLRDDSNTPYKLSKYSITDNMRGPILFDEYSSAFVSASGTGTKLISLSDDPDTDLPSNNTNKNLLFMGIKRLIYIPYPVYSYKSEGYAIFQDKTDPSEKSLAYITYTPVSYYVRSIKIVETTINPADKLYDANMYTFIYEDESMMYFVNNNEVWSRNLVNGLEELQFTPPSGEIVTYIRHRKLEEDWRSVSVFDYNYVMIGTSSGTNYKVYVFKKTSGNLAATPDFVLEGAGTVRDVMYMSPKVGEYNTYPSSF
jgi:hypothetical protein